MVDSLLVLRLHLDQHLRVQLSFFVKVKFDLEIVRPEDPSGDREDPFSDGFERAGDEQAGPDHYIIQPTPWHSHHLLGVGQAPQLASSTSTCLWVPARR